MQQRRGPGPARSAMWLAGLAVLIWSGWATDFTPAHMGDLGNIPRFLARLFPPDWSVLPEVAGNLWQTVQIALMGAVLATILGFPCSLLAARRTTPHPGVLVVTRALLALLRAVPELVWGLIYITAFDIGPLPGVLALATQGLGVFGAALADLLDGAPTAPQEAIASTGALTPLVIRYGLLPQVMPAAVSQFFYRMEYNIRAAIILGAVGAGGLGQMLMVSFSLFNYREMVVVILGTLALVGAVEALGRWVRKRVS